MQKLSNFIMARPKYPVLTSEIILGLQPSKLISSALAKIILVVLGSLLLAFSAQIKIPLYPVPITGQTLVVLLIGMTYGSKLGGATILLYLLQGLVGLPVFAGSAAGIATLLGPTGGYLFGFLMAAIVMGHLAENGMGRNFVSTAICMAVGNVIIYLIGVIWLTNFIGIEKALAVGVLPFLYGDALKLLVAAMLMPLAWHFVKGLKK